MAAQVLVKLGADLSRVRQQVIQLLSGYSGPSGPIFVEGSTHEDFDSPLHSAGARRPFSEGSRHVLERSLAACVNEGGAEIEPWHLLDGLLDDDGPLVSQLIELGVEPEILRAGMRPHAD